MREFFKNDFSFYTTGLARANIGTQLKSFGQSLVQYGDKELLEPKNWFEAFARLSSLLENKREKQKKVIFLDELPWMNTHRSGFITALEHFWNSWAAARPDILLIVCGSAASWMMDKLINNHGGLHNRITRRMHLKPFTLAETEKYLKSRGILFSQHQIVETYMILGGIPYYLSLLEKGMSLPQNIDKLCFAEDGALCTEYQSLYASLFSKAENHIRIINALGNKRSGMTREELLAASKFTDGGEFSKVLYELEISGFIRSYYAFGKKSRGTVYQLIDFFSLFYLQFMHKKNRDEHFWLNHIDSSIHRAWTGYTFELLALVHIDAIKAALGISGVSTSVCSWRSS
ncbi:MAG: hypothetical protein LBM77_12445, partial [Spirochaetaceae bacterium]|nr:hypothetical protein [Spirochaetaceae bacterium]